MRRSRRRNPGASLELLSQPPNAQLTGSRRSTATCRRLPLVREEIRISGITLARQLDARHSVYHEFRDRGARRGAGLVVGCVFEQGDDAGGFFVARQ